MKDYFFFLAGVLTIVIIFGFFLLKNWSKNYKIVTIKDFWKMKKFAGILLEKDRQLLMYNQNIDKMQRTIDKLEKDLCIKQKERSINSSGSSTITNETKEKPKEEIYFVARTEKRQKSESWSNLDSYEKKLRQAYIEMKRGVRIPELNKKYGFEIKTLYNLRKYNVEEILKKYEKEFNLKDMRFHFDEDLKNCENLDFIVTNMYDMFGKGSKFNFSKIRSIVVAFYRNQYMKEN